MKKLVLDCCISKKFLNIVRNNGIDATYWTSIGACNASDVDIFKWAASNNRFIVTYDRNFSLIHAHSKTITPGLCFLKSYKKDNSYRLSSNLIRAIRDIDIPDNVIISIDENRYRWRRLPLENTTIDYRTPSPLRI